MVEAWVTVLVAVIVALSTLGATFIQNRHSQKRFDKELERAREVDDRERRREVRGEPLLELRDKLASMACKYEKLVDTARRLSTRSDFTYEETEKLLEETIDEDTILMASGNVQQILYMQYDTEIITRVNNIRNTYLLLIEYALDKSRRERLQKEYGELVLKIEADIPEVQELISKRLEEL